MPAKPKVRVERFLEWDGTAHEYRVIASTRVEIQTQRGIVKVGDFLNASELKALEAVSTLDIRKEHN